MNTVPPKGALVFSAQKEHTARKYGYGVVASDEKWEHGHEAISREGIDSKFYANWYIAVFEPICHLEGIGSK